MTNSRIHAVGLVVASKYEIKYASDSKQKDRFNEQDINEVIDELKRNDTFNEVIIDGNTMTCSRELFASVAKKYGVSAQDEENEEDRKYCRHIADAMRAYLENAADTIDGKMHFRFSHELFLK